MSNNAYDVLEERGFVKQVTHEGLRELMDEGPITFYVGFDPTADSLHVGHLIPLMAMAHMQRAGHKPIALLGGGTTMIGDPSGKSDMRRMMSQETIAHNADRFLGQMSRFLDFGDGGAIMRNNADWLLALNYVDFLRDIGTQFSVNRMLTAECYKARLEKGLTFFEFNYMLMQAYDFLVLNRELGCALQMGGDDQWSNILAGADLIRRKEQKPAYGLTVSLLTKSDGKKMGKTESGALWLDPAKTSPYDFYQYWRNVDDADVEKCLALLTFLPMDEVRRLGALKGSEANKAKTVLAFELTRLVHGEQEAGKARAAAEALFGGAKDEGSIPTTCLTADQLAQSAKVFELLEFVGLASSRGEARRLIKSGGVYMNDKRVADEFAEVTDADFIDGALLLRKGKKAYHRVERET